MTDLNIPIADEVVNDFRRKGCNCRHCKGDQCNPNESHGSGAPVVRGLNGCDVTYRRPSSLGKPLEDTFHLDKWAKRTVLYGVATSPSIAASAATLDPEKDKAKLDELAEAALVAAKGDQSAVLGTQLHTVVERLNIGEWTIDDVPEMFRTDAEAYLAELARHGLAVAPGMVELKVVNDTVRAAGTFDMVLGQYVSDLKTGKDVTLGQVGIAVQLATYRYSKLYDVATDVRSDMVPTDDAIGLIVHLPFGTGTCTIIDVDIRKGWEAAQLAATAKSWNYRRDLITPRPASPEQVAAATDRIVEAFPGATIVEDPTADLRARAATIKGDPEALAEMRRWWPQDVTTKEWPTSKLGRIAKAIEQGELVAAMTADDKVVRARIQALDEEAFAIATSWSGEAAVSGHPITAAGDARNRRIVDAMAAVLEQTTNLDWIRSALGVVIDDEIQTSVPLGAAWARLTTAQAAAMAVLAANLADGTCTVDTLTVRGPGLEAVLHAATAA